MITFAAAIAFLTALFGGLFFLTKKRVVSIYRGGVFIVLSGLYFTAFFFIAYIMRENFQ